MKFTKLLLAEGQSPTFPLDFIVEETTQHTYLLSTDKKYLKHSTTDCVIIIPLFNSDEKEVKKLSKKLKESALKDKDFYQRKREGIIIKQGKQFGVAIL